MVKKSEEMIEQEHKNCSCGEECKCKRIKKSTWMIISLLVIVLVFCVGLGVGTFILEGRSSDKCIDAKEEAKNDDEYTVKLFNEKNENYKDISLKTEEDIEEFIHFTDDCIGDEFRKGLFDSSDVVYNEDFKVGYILFSLFAFDETTDYYVKEEFLINEINKVFLEPVDEGAFDYFDNGINGTGFMVNCDNGLCLVSTLAGGCGTGYPWYVTKIVDKRKEGENTIYTIKEFYSDFEEGKCDIRTEKDGKILIKNMCANVEDYDKVVAKVNPEELNTYEMTFDKDNRYVSSKKIN